VRIADLFSGCGGITQGFVEADPGFVPVLAVERELAEAATYAANFPTADVYWGDIERLPASRVHEVDVVVGGPPCQGFSGLGKRDPEDHRNRLWRAYVDVVLATDPKVFVIENVGRFFSSPEFGELEKELQTGRLKGYLYDHGVLNAADFGAPQRRRRAILIATRVGKPALPIPTHDKLARKGRRPWATVRDAIGSLPRQPESTELPHRTIEFEDEFLPGLFTTSQIHIGRTYRPESLQRYAHIAPGQGRLNLPVELQYDCWRRKPTGTTDVLGRLRWDAPSVTIRTEFFKPEKGRYLHPQWSPYGGEDLVNRALTHEEAALLQGFPLDFRWAGTKVQIARQIGNAVPPSLARAIALQSVVPLLRPDLAANIRSTQLELLPDQELVPGRDDAPPTKAVG
jgi:DNA (cytosine-5)-methyltransferase 1